MINLISRSPHSVAEIIGESDYKNYCGLLTSPRNRKNPHSALALGAKWAADNDCFVDFNPRRIINWLNQYRSIADTCLWFNTPDVVRDASATLFNFWIWRDIIHSYGFKPAFTLQNGMDQHQIPWEYCSALFIGGDDEFKYSDYVRGVVSEANKRGVWVHQGRCNSIQRLRYCRAIGCNSFDGTGYSRWVSLSVSHLPYLKDEQLGLL